MTRSPASPARTAGVARVAMPCFDCDEGPCYMNCGPPLMILPPSALAEAERRARFKMRGHAYQPGTGPEGETCGSCVNRRSIQGGAKHFSKCGLMERYWTHGSASDIRRKDPACKFWEAK